jgi:ABC-type nitrate/sulfonate/bicarbonate transport system permease component
MIHVSRTIGRADVIVVGMLVIGLIGSALSAIFEFLEKKFVRGELEK